MKRFLGNKARIPHFLKCIGMSWKVFPELGQESLDVFYWAGLVPALVWEPAGFSCQGREQRGAAAARQVWNPSLEKQLRGGSSQRGEGSERCWAGQGCALSPAGWLGLDLPTLTASVQMFGQMCWVWCS